MTTRKQKRKAVDELVSEDLGTSVIGNITSENITAGLSKSSKLQAGNIDKIKMSLRKLITLDPNKILAEIQKEILKLIAPPVKKTSNLQDRPGSHSGNEDTVIAPTSTPIKSKETTSNTTTLVSRNKELEHFWISKYSNMFAPYLDSGLDVFKPIE